MLHDVQPQLVRQQERFPAVGTLVLQRTLVRVLVLHVPLQTLPPGALDPADVTYERFLLVQGLDMHLELPSDVILLAADVAHVVFLLAVDFKVRREVALVYQDFTTDGTYPAGFAGTG